MIKSKVIDILRTFDEGEFREFGKFVNSPYFNENNKLKETYAILRKYRPGFAQKSLTKENLYSRLFNGKKYNDSTMRKILSGLSKLASEYMIHSGLDRKNTFQKNLILLWGFDEKNLDNHFGKHLTSLDGVYKMIRNIEDDYFKCNFELEVARLNFALGRGKGGFEPENVLKNLTRCSTYIICYCLITTFKLNQDILVTGVSYDFDYKKTIAYEFIESLQPEGFLRKVREYAPEFYPVIAIYYNRFMIASGKDESGEFYRELKKLVLSNIELFSRFEKYNLMLFLENSCDEKILNGKDFRKELHHIHKEMLSKGLYTSEDKDYFPLIRFRKVIRNALSINELSWTEKFMENYLDKLPVNYRREMYCYSKAMLQFKSGDFERALENISKVKFEVYSMKYDVWLVKLCTEFELGYFEQALYSIDSYKHLLKNDNTSPVRMKERFINFITYYLKILKLKSGEKTGSIDNEILKNEIEAAKVLWEKDWLLEKLNEHISGNNLN